MNAEDVVQFLRDSLRTRLRLQGRQARFSYGDSSRTDLFLNFTNLPAGVGSAGGGAEAENNRMLFCLRPNSSTGQVRVEMLVSALPRTHRLRTKTTTPEKAAQYVADFLNKVVEEVPPNFTHTDPTTL